MISSKVNILKLSDPSYPEALKHIAKPPQKLFIMGLLPQEWLGRPKLAIVGSRKITDYGRSVTKELAGALARQGVIIISGLAYGVDAAAHQAALDAGGTTVAVLGTDLSRIYPAAHEQLASRIIDSGGSLISEYPNGTATLPTNFIARNRIISGLADGVLVTEAAVNSGSLHTAHFGLEQGKVVMAVPGNIDSPTSVGCNNLIKSGALPVTDADDIFFAMGISPTKQQTLRIFSGTTQEQLVLELLQRGVHSQEEIALICKLESRAVSSALTMLEINGLIKPYGNGRWIAL